MIAVSSRSRVAKLLGALVSLILALAIPVQSMTVLAAKLCDSTFGAPAAAHHHPGGEAPQSAAAENPSDDPSCPPCDTCCAGELMAVARETPVARCAEAVSPAAIGHRAPQSDPTPFFRPPRPL